MIEKRDSQLDTDIDRFFQEQRHTGSTPLSRTRLAAARAAAAERPRSSRFMLGPIAALVAAAAVLFVTIGVPVFPPQPDILPAPYAIDETASPAGQIVWTWNLESDPENGLAEPDETSALFERLNEEIAAIDRTLWSISGGESESSADDDTNLAGIAWVFLSDA